MFDHVKIAPSILSANFLDLGSDIRLIEEAGAGFIHVDVMDGHFVPNLTMGVPLVKQLARIANIPLDVHLMISNPLTQLPWFIDAGADILTVHMEALANEDEVWQALTLIREGGVKAALTVKPGTSVECLAPFMNALDMVLIMSVEPGFSGQSYIEGSDAKVARVVEMARAAGCAPLIEVDGGMGIATVGKVSSCGADVIVCGNAVFGAQDPAAAIREVTRAAEDAR